MRCTCLRVWAAIQSEKVGSREQYLSSFGYCSLSNVFPGLFERRYWTNGSKEVQVISWVSFRVSNYIIFLYPSHACIQDSDVARVFEQKPCIIKLIRAKLQYFHLFAQLIAVPAHISKQNSRTAPGIIITFLLIETLPSTISIILPVELSFRRFVNRKQVYTLHRTLLTLKQHNNSTSESSRRTEGRNKTDPFFTLHRKKHKGVRNE